MRVLLIAHEFAPIPSPQSLRWTYLVREIAALGHRVEVLAPDHPGYGPSRGLPALPEDVVVHRTSPGRFTRVLSTLLALRRSATPLNTGGVGAAPTPQRAVVRAGPVRLNWKGRLVERIRTLYASGLFPDIRAEWNAPARKALRPLLASMNPDLVVVSHEPASTLPLGLLAKRLGYRLVADLGDPVCAPYTPRRWRRRAWRLERAICEKADLITVTTANTRRLLSERHGIDEARMHVMPQGYDARAFSAAPSAGSLFDSARLELLYTGSFYAFRRHEALLEAVLAMQCVRLNIASAAVPPSIAAAARQHPDRIRLFGFLPHDDVLALQRSADLLVNLANGDPAQVPGKIYEYLGAGRPILHVGDNPADEAIALLVQTRAGSACANNAEAIRATLEQYRDRDRNQRDATGGRDEAAIEAYAWSAQARALMERVEPGRAAKAI